MVDAHVPLPSDVLPAGLSQLRALAQALTAAPPLGEANLRVVVSVPTLRLAGVVAALGALVSEVECRDCAHTDLRPGVAVSAWATGKFVDVTLDGVGDEELRFAGLRVRGHREAVHRLPDGFPERRAAKFGEFRREQITAALGCSSAVAGQQQSARCAHPVVVAGEPGAFRDDVADLAAAMTRTPLRGLVDAGPGLGSWFRFPVLLMASIPGAASAPWATALRPRLVIITGAAGWASSSRQLWPGVPHLVLLSRRSASACEVADLLSASGWPAPASLPPAVAAHAAPGHGLEILTLIEPAVAAGPDTVAGGVGGADDAEDLW